MKIKLAEIVTIHGSLERLGKIKGLPVWKEVLLNKVITKKVITEEQAYLESIRKDLIEEFVKKDENGKPVINDNKYMFDEDNESKFTQAFSEVVKSSEQKEFDLPLHVIKLDDFTGKVAETNELADILEGLYGTVVNGD
jgi:hypothetical protein